MSTSCCGPGTLPPQLQSYCREWQKDPGRQEGLQVTCKKSERSHSPPGVIGESKEVDGCRVALQFKGSHNLLEVPFFPKADFPNFYIWGEAT